MTTATRHTLTSADAPIQYCYDRGWTDGLPVVPPTEERVAANAGAEKAAMSGMPDLKIVGIPFPFASLPPEEARARGVRVFDAIVAALTGAEAR